MFSPGIPGDFPYPPRGKERHSLMTLIAPEAEEILTVNSTDSIDNASVIEEVEHDADTLNSGDEDLSGDAPHKGSPGLQQAESETMPILMWSKLSGCVQCNASKRKLDESGIPYQIRYLEEHPEKANQFRNRGFMSAPVMITADNIWAGFRPDLIDVVIAEWQADQLLAESAQDCTYQTETNIGTTDGTTDGNNEN
ncbi:MAG: hypothetical protein B5766_05410 [Candidatus Lumbricidophila eiseniae]|uniref:Glutaredoxin domain-containing protein n=1 Tax=Candidatus Lumbricidiphila eiseniae TaxID=1969409 RepID=A0A2A6FRJ5_9MICO|nr:MAG: hypothetical protein B5766_05410 [Candidatus Lumbricidophila eiseniae]